ncbi:MAG: porin, partial [Alphaproteobacteria bacterium]|nr:porin [Alphaproteobacteria bacterium]
IVQGGQVGLGFLTDAVYGTGSSLELTTAWSVTAGVEHYWTPALRTSVYGGYSAISYNANATTLICGGGGIGRAGGSSVGFTPANCSPNFSFFQVGTRTIWNPVPNLDLGLEVMYNRVQTAFAGNVTTPAGTVLPAYTAPTTFVAADTGVFSAVFRAQRNFWP